MVQLNSAFSYKSRLFMFHHFNHISGPIPGLNFHEAAVNENGAPLTHSLKKNPRDFLGLDISILCEIFLA